MNFMICIYFVYTKHFECNIWSDQVQQKGTILLNVWQVPNYEEKTYYLHNHYQNPYETFALVWAPQIVDSHWNKIQTAQNAALSTNSFKFWQQLIRNIMYVFETYKIMHKNKKNYGNIFKFK